MKVAGKIMVARRQNIGLYVSIDTIGEGAGVYSRCVKLVIRRQHGSRVVSWVQPITDSPKQISTHIEELVLPRDVTQFTPVRGLCAL